MSPPSAPPKGRRSRRRTTPRVAIVASVGAGTLPFTGAKPIGLFVFGLCAADRWRVHVDRGTRPQPARVRRGRVGPAALVRSRFDPTF